MRKHEATAVLSLLLGFLAIHPAQGAWVEHEKDRVFIVDQLGER